MLLPTKALDTPFVLYNIILSREEKRGTSRHEQDYGLDCEFVVGGRVTVSIPPGWIAPLRTSDIYHPKIRVERPPATALAFFSSLPRLGETRGERECRLSSPQEEVQTKKHCDSDRRCQEARRRAFWNQPGLILLDCLPLLVRAEMGKGVGRAPETVETAGQRTGSHAAPCV